MNLVHELPRRACSAALFALAAAAHAAGAQAPAPGDLAGPPPVPPVASPATETATTRPPFLALPRAAVASEVAAAEPAPRKRDDDEGWRVSVAPYAFLSSVDAELRAGDRVVEVDASQVQVKDVLKFAAAARVEAQHDDWGFAVDNNYVKLGDDIVSERAVVPDFRFELVMNVTEIEPRYRLWSGGEQDEPTGGPKFEVDLVGGVRVIHFETDLLLRRLVADDERRIGSSTYVHGYVGNRLVWSPWRYVSLEGRYNVALASDLSWFVNGNVDVRPWEHFSVGAGLQVLDVRLENDSAETALDGRLAGPVLFMKIHF